MAGLLVTVSEFRDRAVNDLDGLVGSLKNITGRSGDEEEQAWRHSLPAAAKAFEVPSFDNFHLYFGGEGSLALEYRLPSAPYWCDMVMLGAHQGQPSAVIVELKDWQTRSDKPGPIEGLMLRQGREDLHPSDQVRGYTEYCRKFHSTVAEQNAQVHGCVLFTRDFFCQAYGLAPNDRLAQDYPFFTLSPDDLAIRLPAYFSDRLSTADEKFAEGFAAGFYRQDRSFVQAIAQQLADPTTSPLVLLEGQRRALSLCRLNIETSIFETRGPQKTVVVVEGPPGSGKSVVAARLWASLVMDARLPGGNVTFVTTSAAQSSNWWSLFSDTANDVAARGVVLTANEYIPYTTRDVSRIRQTNSRSLSDIEKWRENYRLMCQLLPDKHRSPDDHYLVSIVDEAHALINPEHSDGRGQFGFAVHAGPHAYHIIRSSTISVFFLDRQQSFRERETTSVPDIQKWANDLQAKFIGPLSLADAQFRCGGSKEYIDWVDSICSAQSRAVQEIPRPYANALFNFQVFDTPFAMESELEKIIAAGRTARFVASYAREWKTKDKTNPHDLPDRFKDFYEPIKIGGNTHRWAKIWNYIPRGTDYTPFIRAPKGSRMYENPLSEVGCPYAVRGFDFDYVGLLWLGDLKWRDGNWTVDLEHVFESGLTRHQQRAARERDPNGPEHKKLIDKLLQGYRILLTRAMQGVYLWFEDPETRQYVEGNYHNAFRTE